MRDERRGNPGGPVAEWHAGCVVLGGERFGRRDAPYAAPREWQGAQVGGLPERDESPDVLRPKNRKRPEKTSPHSKVSDRALRA